MVNRTEEVADQAGMTTSNALMPDWLHRQAQVRGDRPAIIIEERQLSFAEINAGATAMARRLSAAGVLPGDRVAVLLANGVDFVYLAHAVSRVGAVLVPLNFRLTPSELAYQLEDVGSRLLLCDDSTANLALETVEVMQTTPRVFSVEAAAEGTSASCSVEPLSGLPLAKVNLRLHIDLSAIHTVLYTSGTTGRPKGVMLTYGNHWWSATASALNLRLHEEDVWLACLPFFHTGGLAILMRSVIYGMPAEIQRRFDPNAVNQAIDAGRIRLVSLVSTMLEKVIEARGERPFPASLRAILLGGGPTPPPLLQRCVQMRAPVVTSYGMTETASQVVAVPLEFAPDPDGSAGHPLLPAEVRVGGADASLPAGEVGEILVRGPMITPGYWGQREASLESRKGGWFHTGDFGYLDETGRLFVVDRRDDLIISGGENVYPAEVEAVVAMHPAIAEVAVIAAPSERWGQVPVAVVVRRADRLLEIDDLMDFCRERLAGYKVPARIYCVEELPRNATGKVLRRKLAARFGSNSVE